MTRERVYNRAGLMNTAHVIVITGSTRGIGYGLAEAFLTRGCRVMICGRSSPLVESAIERLTKSGNAAGRVCNVSDASDLQALWDDAVSRFGRVDVWINNA